jgi:hypothetical protein
VEVDHQLEREQWQASIAELRKEVGRLRTNQENKVH